MHVSHDDKYKNLITERLTEYSTALNEHSLHHRSDGDINRLKTMENAFIGSADTGN